ncbi:MAG: helix-turn-helix transcriptional regulator [Cellulosilyticaceae bacterium]
MKRETLELLKRLAKGVSEEFGTACEVAIHEIHQEEQESSIVAIENGHVTNRNIGDGPSQAVLDGIKHHKDTKDRLNYRTLTEDGRVLRSSTIYIKDGEGEVEGVFSINYDISQLLMMESCMKQLINDKEEEPKRLNKITKNVGDLLDELIEQSVRLVGKPVAFMTKEDKKKAMQFLNESGAFLITKSGDKVSEYFGISKYTLYNYIDIKS